LLVQRLKTSTLIIPEKVQNSI